MYSVCPLRASPNPSAIIFLSCLSSNPSGLVFKAHSCLRAFTLLVLPAGYALPSNVPISILWKSVQVSPSQRWASLKTTLSNYHFSLSEVICICISSIQFSCSVVSNSLWPHGPQHAGLPEHWLLECPIHQFFPFNCGHLAWILFFPLPLCWLKGNISVTVINRFHFVWTD